MLRAAWLGECTPRPCPQQRPATPSRPVATPSANTAAATAAPCPTCVRSWAAIEGEVGHEQGGVPPLPNQEAAIVRLYARAVEAYQAQGGVLGLHVLPVAADGVGAAQEVVGFAVCQRHLQRVRGDSDDGAGAIDGPLGGGNAPYRREAQRSGCQCQQHCQTECACSIHGCRRLASTMVVSSAQQHRQGQLASCTLLAHPNSPRAGACNTVVGTPDGAVHGASLSIRNTIA